MTNATWQPPYPTPEDCLGMYCLEVWLVDGRTEPIVPAPNDFTFTDSAGHERQVQFSGQGYAKIPQVCAGKGVLRYAGPCKNLGAACGYSGKSEPPRPEKGKELDLGPQKLADGKKPVYGTVYGQKANYTALCRDNGLPLLVEPREDGRCTPHIVQLRTLPCRWEFRNNCPAGCRLRPVIFALTNEKGESFSGVGVSLDGPFPLAEKMHAALSKPWPPASSKAYEALLVKIKDVEDKFKSDKSNPFLFQLKCVNAGVNISIGYVKDGEGEDFWAPPAHTVHEGTGDCEDYALLKYAILRERGVAEENMRIFVHRVRNVGHAILLVYDTGGNTWYRLDNLDSEVLEKCQKFKGTGYKNAEGKLRYELMKLVCREYEQIATKTKTL